MGRLHNLFIDQFNDDITFVYINSDDCDDLVTKIFSQIGSYTLDQLVDSMDSLLTIVLHGGFTSTFKFFEGTSGLLCPHNLSGQE